MANLVSMLNSKIQSYKDVVQDLELINDLSMSKSDHKIALSLHCIELLNTIIIHLEEEKNGSKPKQ